MTALDLYYDRRVANDLLDLLKPDGFLHSFIDGMLQQRIAIGLMAPRPVEWSDPLQIVPVVAIGAGKPSPKALGRLQQVDNVVRAAFPLTGDVAPLEVWRLDESGRVRERR